MSIKSSALLACPFCGETEVLIDSFNDQYRLVHCRKCGCGGPMEKTASAARKKWNKRQKANAESEVSE